MNKTLLIIEPDRTIRNLHRKLFGDSFEIITTNDLQEGLGVLKENSIDGVILDFEFIADENFSVIQEIKSSKEQPALIITGQTTAHELLKCIRTGADDFIEKPFMDLNILKTSVEKALEQHVRKVQESTDSQDDDQKISEANHLVGQSKQILELKRLIYKVAPLDATVLILGETGTGKEVVARMIHNVSSRKDYNFLAVHCGGIPDTLLESTLFGHEKGSFTGAYKTHKGYFEVANKGTIFLDEIGDTTQSFQVKLLRVLQDKQFRRIGGTETLTTSARIIAATNRNLKKEVEEGKFREDLYYRLNVITLRISPLRERPDDIPLLIRYFLQIYSKKHNHLGIYLKPETIEILQRQPWRGNVRELENVIERLVALSETDWIGPSELPEEYLNPPEATSSDKLPLLPYAEAKERFEKEYVTKLLNMTNGNVSKAAKLAGMPRQNLHIKIKKHHLKRNTDKENQSDKKSSYALAE